MRWPWPLNDSKVKVISGTKTTILRICSFELKITNGFMNCFGNLCYLCSSDFLNVFKDAPTSQRDNYRIAGNFRGRKFLRFKGKSVWDNFCDFYFRDFKWTDLWISVGINYCGFYFRESVYSPRNRENKNPAKIFFKKRLPEHKILKLIPPLFNTVEYLIALYDRLNALIASFRRKISDCFLSLLNFLTKLSLCIACMVCRLRWKFHQVGR